jgi:hypothetical protein
VDISTALVHDLKNLMTVLDQVDLDLEGSLRALRSDAQHAVSSFVGLSLTLVVDGQRVTLTSVDEDSDLLPIASSLRVPLGVAGSTTGPDLVLYATTAGAFVDLAADLTYALAASPTELRVDQDLAPASTRSGLSGVAELSMINRAIGVLMGRGLSPEEARARLEQQAGRSRLKLFQAAAYLISTTE